MFIKTVLSIAFVATSFYGFCQNKEDSTQILINQKSGIITLENGVVRISSTFGSIDVGPQNGAWGIFTPIDLSSY